MSIHAFWDNEDQNVIRFLYRRGNWEWHDFYAALEQARLLAGSAGQPVGFIIDITYGSLTPGIFMSQSKILYEFKRHPEISHVIVIGADRFIEALYHIATANVPVKDLYYFAQTLDDAYVIIDEANRLPQAASDR